MIQLRQSLQKKINTLFSNPQTQYNESLIQSFFVHLFVPGFYDLLDHLLQKKEIWYLRHAQSPINVFYQQAQNFGKPYSKEEKFFDPSITQRGQYQLSCLPILYFDAAYISPMTRTLQTFSNINVKVRKQPIVTPLIRQKTKALAGVVGSSKQILQKKFPLFNYQWIRDNQYWWRHDYKNQAYNDIQYESTSSFKARIALFFLIILLEGSLNILVVSHMAFYDAIHKPQYFERAANARLILLEHKDIVNLFRRIQKRLKPKL